VPSYTNILHLCSALHPHHVCNYMQANGWEVDDQQREDVLFFKKKGDEDIVYQFWIWSTPDHPKFISRVQNLLFLMVGIEEREALEIGNEMLEHEETLPTQSCGEAVHVRITNASAVLMDCRIEGSQLGHHELTSGETIELAFRSEEHICPEIVLNDSCLEVLGGVSDHVQVFQSGPSESKSFSIELTVREELARGEISTDTVSDLLLELKSVLARADFELNVGVRVEQESIRRQAAIVITTLAKRLADFATAEIILWRITVRIMATANLQLELTPNSISELFRVAREDDEAAPSQTANWLKESSQNVFFDVNRVSRNG